MPNIGAWAVKQWQFTLVLFGLLIVMGVNSFMTIPRAEDPHFPIPVFIVRIALPGADAQEIEKLIVDPVEDAIDVLDDVKSIESNSIDGIGIIIVEFEWTVDVDEKYNDVIRETNALVPQLPEAVSRVEIERVRTTRASVVQVALVSETASWRTFEDIADRLTEDLERAPGVWKADFWGVPNLEIRVSLDLGRMAELGIPVTRVAEVLSAEGAETPGGIVHINGRRFNVTATGAFDTLDEIADVLVAERDGHTIRIRDIADVAWEPTEHRHITRAEGKRAIFISANQKEYLNVYDVRDAIWKVLDEFEPTLPDEIEMVRYFDQTVNVSHRLDRLLRDFGIAIGLVLITLLPLGLRASVIVMISIPLSLAIGIAALQFTGFSLNQLSIAGAILALGLLVDDTIVVTENIERHLRQGSSRMQAAIEATTQITPAVLGATGVLMFAFLPLLFLPEAAGLFTRSLPVTVLYTVAASLFVALTIIPFLASRILHQKPDPRGNIVLRIVMGGIHAFYRPLLHLALMFPRLTLIAATVGFFLTLPLAGQLGFTLFPPSGSPQFMIDIETPEGTALAKTGEALERVEAILRDEPEIDWYLSNLGRGHPEIYYNIITNETASNFAAIAVSLHEWTRKGGPEIIDKLRARFAEIPGAQITVRIFENGPPLDAPIAIFINGRDLDVLKDLSAKVTAAIENTPGTRDVNNPIRVDRTDIDLNIDTGKAGVLGVPAGAVDRTLRLALEGEPVARFRDTDGDDYPVTVRMPLNVRNDFDALGNIYLPSETGDGIPLSSVSEPEFKQSPALISRYNRERTVTVTSFLETGTVLSKVTADVEAAIAEIEIPPGYSLSTGGTAEELEASLSGLTNAGMIAIFGIMMVLILEFRSFAVTAIVAGVIPLGVIGGLIALFLTGFPLSYTAILGFIALTGIEIKNSILLVDFANQLRRDGVPLRQAIERAGEIRFLPVLLTSATAIGGLLPLALEDSELYSPLAWVIIGGLVASTFLSRLVTPVMYYLLAPRKIGDLQALGA